MRAVLAGLLLAGSIAAPAMAQMDSREGIALQNQIMELRRDLQSLQSQRGGAPLPPPSPRSAGGGSEISAQLLDRVQSLEDEVRRLHGQLDEQNNAMQRMQADLGKQIGDLGFRMQNSGSAGAAPGLAAPAPTTLNTPAAPVRRTPELAMQEGNAALARRDYAMAEADAREVLATGRGPRAADAQFLLAQTLMGKKDYQGAAVAYDDAYNRSRTGPRAPNALLGVASALLMLNDRAAACVSLDKIRAEFPAERGDVRESAAALRGRAGCR